MKLPIDTGNSDTGIENGLKCFTSYTMGMLQLQADV